MTVRFEPRDIWIGVFWDRRADGLHVYVCPFPCLVFHWVSGTTSEREELTMKHSTEPDTKEPVTAEPVPLPKYDVQQRRMTRCQSNSDGECYWEHCPQLHDNEPTQSGRHCPHDRDEDEGGTGP